MLSALSFVASLVLCPVPVSAPRGEPVVSTPRAAADSALASLFERGVPYATFLANAKARRELWDRNSTWSTPPEALVQRARATGGGWKLLAVAVDGCSDSVNTIPYIAQLVALLPGVELRIIGSDVGRAIMEAHRTPDQRAATPTVLLLDATFVERGAFIERPPELQQWMLAQKGVMSDADAHTRKMAWYDEDKGVKTLAEIVALMERAHAARR
ncbi:MAG: thioredoxin family protein [Gemmatimonadaceae bacterium]|nr:thioredoxin family protein [Gemmatimonadaceae bacterium]